MDDSIYKGFACVYDALMTNAPYDAWAAYIDDVLKKRLNFPECGQPLVLDLACGTGNITLRLAKMGYDMIGVDCSADMLAEARRKADEENVDLLLLAQDMRELDLYGTVDAAICVCDGLNYILTEQELGDIFKRVRLFLNPGGVFIFDMNTEYKFKEQLSNHSFESQESTGEAYTWDNVYHAQEKINEYKITFYTTGESEPFIETHYQRAYAPEDVCRLLTQAGFAATAVHDGYNDAPYHDKSGRVVFIGS